MNAQPAISDDVAVAINDRPEPEFARIADAMLDKLVDDMNGTGFGVIEDYVSVAKLQRMQQFVSAATGGVGQQYTGFAGKDAVAGTIFSEIGGSASFRDLMRRVYERGTGRTAPASDYYQVLRCLAGQAGQDHSLIFHYDSFVVTALMPVAIPQGPQSGDLVMLPNRRRIRKLYLANLLDKIVLDNKMSQAALRFLHKVGLLRVVRLKMIPGNIYFFWGYRSVHANEACDPAHLRATAIFHFANPHGQSQFRARVRAWLPR
jgi:hypothetical protein